MTGLCFPAFAAATVQPYSPTVDHIRQVGLGGGPAFLKESCSIFSERPSRLSPAVFPRCGFGPPVVAWFGFAWLWGGCARLGLLPSGTKAEPHLGPKKASASLIPKKNPLSSEVPHKQSQNKTRTEHGLLVLNRQPFCELRAHT